MEESSRPIVSRFPVTAPSISEWLLKTHAPAKVAQCEHRFPLEASESLQYPETDEGTTRQDSNQPYQLSACSDRVEIGN